MNTLLMPIVVVCFISFSTTGFKEKQKEKPMEEFHGTWKYISLVYDGREFGPEKVKEFRCIFRGDEFTFRVAELTTAHGKYQVSATQEYQTIDLERTDKAQRGKTHLGIYRFDGDKLWLCYAAPGRERPTEFTAATNSGRTLIVLQKHSL